jgi:hypothetical protein
MEDSANGFVQFFTDNHIMDSLLSSISDYKHATTRLAEMSEETHQIATHLTRTLADLKSLTQWIDEYTIDSEKEVCFFFVLFVFFLICDQKFRAYQIAQQQELAQLKRANQFPLNLASLLSSFFCFFSVHREKQAALTWQIAQTKLALQKEQSVSLFSPLSVTCRAQLLLLLCIAFFSLLLF